MTTICEITMRACEAALRAVTAGNGLEKHFGSLSAVSTNDMSRSSNVLLFKTDEPNGSIRTSPHFGGQTTVATIKRMISVTINSAKGQRTCRTNTFCPFRNWQAFSALQSLQMRAPSTINIPQYMHQSWLIHSLSRAAHSMSGISSIDPASKYRESDMRKEPKQIKHKKLG